MRALGARLGHVFAVCGCMGRSRRWLGNGRVSPTAAHACDGGGGGAAQVECCIRCLSQGVNAAHIIDGRSKHSVLMELLTDEVRVNRQGTTVLMRHC